MKNYLDLMQRIIDEGVEKPSRPGINTLSIFGTQLRWNLQEGFPLLTTKRVFWRGIVEELLWFIRGDTNSKNLEAKGVNIWKPNTTREFLDKRGLNYLPEGNIGLGYGFQWRCFDGWWGVIVGEDTPRNHVGVDQLQQVVDTLRTNPNDRRMIVSAWNPRQLKKTALPPCHLLYQFYVSDNKLNCMWTQRSIDTCLGLPFNVGSYALLTHLIAKITGFEVGDLIFSGGDTHIYTNQLEGCAEQLQREPRELPTLKIKKDIKTLEDIENMCFEDFDLENYNPHSKIKFPFAT